jgi:hypothetical protein
LVYIHDQKEVSKAQYDTYPNYTDTSNLPAAGTSAVWRYKAIYRYGDAQAGLWSDVVSITVTGV